MENSTISPLINAQIQSELANNYLKLKDYSNSIKSHYKASNDFNLAATQSSDNKLSKQLQSLSVKHELQAKSLETRIHEQPQQPPLQSSSPSSSKGLDLDELSVYEDPFNKYFNTIEGLLRDISNPVAFATAPLDGQPLSANDDITSSYEFVDESNSSNKPSIIQTATNLFNNFKSYSLNLTPFQHSQDLDNASHVIKQLMHENTQLKNKLAEFQRRDKMHDALKGSIIKFGSEYKVRIF